MEKTSFKLPAQPGLLLGDLLVYWCCTLNYAPTGYLWNCSFVCTEVKRWHAKEKKPSVHLIQEKKRLRRRLRPSWTIVWRFMMSSGLYGLFQKNVDRFLSFKLLSCFASQPLEELLTTTAKHDLSLVLLYFIHLRIMTPVKKRWAVQSFI